MFLRERCVLSEPRIHAHQLIPFGKYAGIYLFLNKQCSLISIGLKSMMDNDLLSWKM